jgi:hypothetical protein
MYQLNARTMRKYRENVRTGKSFKMELKTAEGSVEGSVEVYADTGGYATMRNPEDGRFNISIGRTSHVLDLIDENKPLPLPKSLDATRSVPVDLRPAIQQAVDVDTTAVVTVDSLPPPTNVPEATPKRAAESKGHRSDNRAMPNAEKVVMAALSGVKSLRANNDVLQTLPGGQRTWRYIYMSLVDRHWRVTTNEVVALFEPGGEFTCPSSETPAVRRRQEMLKARSASGEKEAS